MPHRTRIKICGMTRAADALLAAQLGVDAIGVVLHAPGRVRAVSMETASAIFSVLPAFVSRIGLFVDADPDLIIDRAIKLQLSHVQLHGTETLSLVNALSPISVIKAVTVEDAGIWISSRPANLAAILIDSPTKAGSGVGGGTGHANDWDAVEALLQGRSDLPPIVLAGGLNAENVGEVVRRFSGFLDTLSVDVSSGVEEAVPGLKSAERMQAFVRAVNAQM